MNAALDSLSYCWPSNSGYVSLAHTSRPTPGIVPLELIIELVTVLLIVVFITSSRLTSAPSSANHLTDYWHSIFRCTQLKYELSLRDLELIQTQMTQKPMLRAEVYAHAYSFAGLEAP